MYRFTYRCTITNQRSSHVLSDACLHERISLALMRMQNRSCLSR